MFTKYIRTFTIFALLALVANSASAGIITKPYTFQNGPGNPVDATKVNADYDTLYTLVNGNIDNTNINFIYASTVKPTTVGQAIFGGVVGYTFNPNVAGQVPLTIIGATSQSADLFDICGVGAACSGTKFDWFDSAGVLHTNAAPAFGGIPSWTGALPRTQGGTGVTSIPTTTCLGWNGSAFSSPACLLTASSPLSVSSNNVSCSTCAVTNSNNNFSSAQTVNGLFTTTGNIVYGLLGAASLQVNGVQTLFLPASASQPFVFANATNTVANVVIPDAGGLKTDTSATTTVSYVPPVYTAAGAAVASTEHIVSSTTTITASGPCGADLANCNNITGGTALTFSGAAAFTSASTYQCSVSLDSTSSPGSALFLGINRSSGSSATVTVGNPFSASATTNGMIVQYICIGN